MLKRLVAIAFIFACTSAAWLILGATLAMRSNSSEDRLRGRVQSVWGAEQVQTAPSGEYSVPVRYSETITENGRQRVEEKTRYETSTIRPSASDIAVGLQLEHRRKGLLWYSTYKVSFRGDYEFRNPTMETQKARVYLKFPAAQAVYDDLQFVVNGQAASVVTEKERAYVPVELGPGAAAKVQIAYRSQGLDRWKYSFGQSVNPVENFHLRMTTNFRDIDFPDNTLAPSEKRDTAGGWQLDWNYKNLVSGYEIAMAMPEELQPGPLASEISFFAPVSLFFFFFLMFIITAMRRVDLHPMNYFFLAAAFFAFHLLLAYLVDHLDINISFAISSAVSIFLVVSYLRLVTGTQFAIREAAIAQLIYLVLFSYAFFFKGFTGLSVTIGAIVTLFVVMQMTGRINWAHRFAGAAPPPLTQI
jgi:inner membrane protein involved in colicin E2 resistance